MIKRKINAVFSAIGISMIFVFILSSAAQRIKEPSQYEVEILGNPSANKRDTREINAILIFEKERMLVKSRRKPEIFKEIKYSDIKSAEHSYSRSPLISDSEHEGFWSFFTSIWVWPGIEKHWLTVIAEDDFFVLKLENDNFRMIKAEFAIRKIELVNVDEVKGGDRRKAPKPKSS